MGFSHRPATMTDENGPEPRLFDKGDTRTHRQDGDFCRMRIIDRHRAQEATRPSPEEDLRWQTSRIDPAEFD